MNSDTELLLEKVREHRSIPRDLVAIPCPECLGYAERVDLNEKEKDQSHCGECCGRAFVCLNCNHRIYLHAEAPEME
jgi:hypothetical protein